MRGRPVAPGTQHTDGMGVVDGEGGAVLLRDLEQVRHVGDVSLHRVDAVHDDHDAGARRHLLQLALEVAEVAVIEAYRLAVGHFGAVHDRGVIQLVQEDEVAPAHQSRHDAEVRLVAGRKHDAGFLAEELRQLGFQLLVQIQSAVQEAASRAA